MLRLPSDTSAEIDKYLADSDRVMLSWTCHGLGPAIKCFSRSFMVACTPAQYLCVIEHHGGRDDDVGFAAAGGNVHMVEYLMSMRPGDFSQVSKIAENASAGGHTSVLQWLLDNNVSMFSVDVGMCIKTAATAGHLYVIEWFYDQHNHAELYQLKKAHELACIHDHPHIITWLHDNNLHQARDRGNIISNANRFSDRVITLLHKYDLLDVTSVYEYAISAGVLRVLNLMYTLEPPDTIGVRLWDIWDPHNSIPQLDWIHSHNVNWNYNKFIKAAAGRQIIDIVMWIIAHYTVGAAAAKDVSSALALNGHLDTLVIFHQSYPIDPKIWFVASEHGKTQVLDWLLQVDPDHVFMAQYGAEYDDSGSTIQWLTENGIGRDERFRDVIHILRG